MPDLAAKPRSRRGSQGRAVRPRRRRPRRGDLDGRDGDAIIEASPEAAAQGSAAVTVLDSTEDPDGRRVELTVERWSHIVEDEPGHPELIGHRAAVLGAVRAPDAVRPGRADNERWYFLRDAGPSRWLHVVVAYEGDRGWIVTAFGRRREP